MVQYNRQSIRLKNYDYGAKGYYFITICCKNMQHLFGSVQDGKMQLNSIGLIVLKEWYATEKIRDNCKIHECIIMPNHIHGIIEITSAKNPFGKSAGFHSPSHTIGSIVRGFKISSIKKIREYLNDESTFHSDFLLNDINGNSNFRGESELSKYASLISPVNPNISQKIKSFDFKIWHRNYYDRIIRDRSAYINIVNYIHSNPIKWGKVKKIRFTQK